MDFDTASQSLSPNASPHPNLRLPATCDPPSEHNPPKQASWIVFGATGHIGRSLVRALLSHGDKCTAVGWTTENTPLQMRQWAASLEASFSPSAPSTKSKSQSHSDRSNTSGKSCLGLLCDVRVRETVEAVINHHISVFNSVDIIANCTGYGVIGACEDQDDYDLRNQFATNFMGTLNVIQLSLPHFRAQGHGRYLVFSSTAGALGVPGLGPYCATKYAVEGLIESMLYEIDVFGIKATLVEPGHVRLDEPDDIAAGASSNSMAASGPSHPMMTGGNQFSAAPTAAASSTARNSAAGGNPGPPKPKRYGHFWVKPNPSPPYAPLNSPARHAKRMVQWLNDRQPVSAVKSAELVWQLGHCSYPPLRLLLGSYAVDSIRDRLRSIIEEIEDWKHLSFPATMTPEEETEKGVEDARRLKTEHEDEDMQHNE